MKREWIDINKNVGVSVVFREDGLYDASVMTNWFPSLSKSKWKTEEDYVPTREGLSSMQVYGYIEYEVKPAYLN
ncbi:hypothetical protein ACH6EH_07240 [Paenibacillus sp. JSM ZJ436]|uniref:hypothetical protein n=1 Tax=Paenibacillus sp. JSM ZJ436 TaxID=3376190 RepID=UPI0037910928